MFSSTKVREIMIQCLENQDNGFIFSTTSFKELIAKEGYIYNKDYEVNAFNNAIYSLAQRKYIVPTGEKGHYRLNKTVDHDERKDDEEMRTTNTPEKEPELKNMRKKFMDCLNESRGNLAAILDAEKPSTYGKNRNTYDKAISLLNYLQSFSFNE